MNKKTRSLTIDEYNLIIDTIRSGFNYNNISYKGNNRIATILVLESNLGIRIGDVLKLRLADIIKDGDRYRLDITESKTNKIRTFTVPIEIYQFIKIYCLENKIKGKIFSISERAVQKHLKNTCDYLGLEGISTHSFRKFFATQIYISSNYNIELVRALLQHSNVSITQKYIGIESKQIEEALQNHMCLR